MYYEESSTLIKHRPLDKDAIKVLDRELAHAYAPDGRGYIELPLLRQKAHLSTAEIENLMERYKSNRIVNNYAQVTCPCGVNYDSSEESCGDCGRPVTEASPNGVTCYRILMQPMAPAYDPASQPTDPKVFISYRHGFVA